MGHRRLLPGLHDLLANPEVEAVSVTTWPTAHAGPVIAAAEAGKHILCEKPIATTLEDADAMVAAAEQAGVKFAMGYQPRFGNVWPTVKRLLDEGRLRPAMGINIDRARPLLPPRALVPAEGARRRRHPDGLGHLHRLLHQLAAGTGRARLRHEARPSARRSWSATTLLTDIDVEDTVAATLRFKNGAIGHLVHLPGRCRPATARPVSTAPTARSCMRSGIEGIGVYTTRVDDPDYLHGLAAASGRRAAARRTMHYRKLAHLVDAVLDDTPLVHDRRRRPRCPGTGPGDLPIGRNRRSRSTCRCRATRSRSRRRRRSREWTDSVVCALPGTR